MKKFSYICLLFLINMVNQKALAQSNAELKIADSLYAKQNWKEAKQKYQDYLRDTSTNSLAWNRLGYANQNLGIYQDAINDYSKSLASKPSPALTSVVFVR